MTEADLMREQAWWENKHEDAMRAASYADRQLYRIANKLMEIREAPHRHLQIVRDHVQLVLLHGGETE